MDNDYNVRNGYRDAMTVSRLSSFLIAPLLAACAAGGSVESSIGRVIMESDKYPHGSHFVSDAIDREYVTVRDLPVTERVQFFWSILMNVKLDASYSVELAELIARDCPNEFEQELTAFIEGEGNLPPPEPQTARAKGMLLSLQHLRGRSPASVTR